MFQQELALYISLHGIRRLALVFAKTLKQRALNTVRFLRGTKVNDLPQGLLYKVRSQENILRPALLCSHPRQTPGST